MRYPFVKILHRKGVYLIYLITYEDLQTIIFNTHPADGIDVHTEIFVC